MDASGYVAEVFRSIQGEGPYVGVLQVFVRFAGCSLRCAYCDTPRSRERTPQCSLGGGPEPRAVANPVHSRELSSFIHFLAEASPGLHSVSLTGGEPLEQSEFLGALAEEIRKAGLRVYLETNGLFEDAARAAAPLVDIVSMDIKLPSLCGGGDHFATYRRVLPLFRTREIFCKVVVARGFDTGEFEAAARLVADFDPRTPFIIQPVTPNGSCEGVRGEDLMTSCLTAGAYLDDVRVIPQCHHVLGLE